MRIFGIRAETGLSSRSGWIIERPNRIPAAKNAFDDEGLHIAADPSSITAVYFSETEACTASA